MVEVWLSWAVCFQRLLQGCSLARLDWGRRIHVEGHSCAHRQDSLPHWLAVRGHSQFLAVWAFPWNISQHGSWLIGEKKQDEPENSVDRIQSFMT